MASTRLDSDERRRAIVAAAVPLFARKGFAGTTTRELAEAAGISEALLFRHFPTKETLYREILRAACDGDPALEALAALPPTSKTLVCMVRFMVSRFVLGDDAQRAALDARLRLMLHSYLEDGAYAREFFAAIDARVVPMFAASLAAAAAAGELAADAGSAVNRFWFAQHVAAMMAFAILPERGCVPYQGSAEQFVEEASRFILRGIGMTEAAIDATAPPVPAAAD